jgi:hypothetical protein
MVIWKGGLEFLAGIAWGLVTSKTLGSIFSGEPHYFCTYYNTVPALKTHCASWNQPKSTINFPQIPLGSQETAPRTCAL